MKIINTSIADTKILEPAVYEDERGFFYESFNKQSFTAALGINQEFVQDNHPKSQKGVLRGLHYQIAPMAQAKLVRVIQGEIFDVSVDIRPSSPTFGHWVGITLSAENRRQLWIPEGFAHGFYVLSDNAECAYKTTQYYSQLHEHVIAWKDPELAIAWPLNCTPIVSNKDKQAPLFASCYQR